MLIVRVELIDVELEAIIGDTVDDFDRKVGEGQRMDEIAVALANVLEDNRIIEVRVIPLLRGLSALGLDADKGVNQTRSCTDGFDVGRENGITNGLGGVEGKISTSVAIV